MISPINGIRAPELAPVPGAETGSGSAFASALETAIARVEAFRADSKAATERFLAGEEQDLHRLVIAGQKAELSFELLMEVRNKVVQAYQEVMRMQV
ncbi:MAG: flagellar hook-basal body complex protein FliE [Bryobacteraceae bacterium]|nr:flagellar hook-basal body complex protein FliE [Bryobacteraceae bacterium]